MLDRFSARLMASMAAFNEEIAPSRPVGRWDKLVAIVEAQGGREKMQAVRKNPSAGRDERPSYYPLPHTVQVQLFYDFDRDLIGADETGERFNATDHANTLELKLR
jgi:hypothetical protein